MSRALVRTVHVIDPDTGRPRVFGPGDQVPGWAAEQITNPAAWADDEARERSLSAPDDEQLREVYDAGVTAGGVEAVGELCETAGVDTRDELLALLDGAKDRQEQLTLVLATADVDTVDELLELLSAPAPDAGQESGETGGAPPAKNASRDEWAAYAITQGFDPAEADKATRDDLIARYGD